MPSRYAAYVAPDPPALWRFGSSVIGYDAATGEDVPTPAIGLPENWSDLAAEPRRYGFHGTLKAPFRLADGRTERDLLAAAERLAATRPAVDVPRLTVATIGAFTALVPAERSPAIDALAAACVSDLDDLRAPLSEADRERRLAAPLSARQRDNLDRWGYPHVFADFRFHLTLSGPLPAALREPVRAALEGAYAAVPPGLAVASLAIFRQDDSAGRFRILARLPLRG